MQILLVGNQGRRIWTISFDPSTSSSCYFGGGKITGNIFCPNEMHLVAPVLARTSVPGGLRFAVWSLGALPSLVLPSLWSLRLVAPVSVIAEISRSLWSLIRIGDGSLGRSASGVVSMASTIDTIIIGSLGGRDILIFISGSGAGGTGACGLAVIMVGAASVSSAEHTVGRIRQFESPYSVRLTVFKVYLQGWSALLHLVGHAPPIGLPIVLDWSALSCYMMHAPLSSVPIENRAAALFHPPTYEHNTKSLNITSGRALHLFRSHLIVLNCGSIPHFTKCFISDRRKYFASNHFPTIRSQSPFGYQLGRWLSSWHELYLMMASWISFITMTIKARLELIEDKKLLRYDLALPSILSSNLGAWMGKVVSKLQLNVNPKEMLRSITKILVFHSRFTWEFSRKLERLKNVWACVLAKMKSYKLKIRLMQGYED
ncbi:hypothetical protein Syun_014165 [Stephania yunnanensis]|uniref:Uncharacterized protein n=1 Tax=Stephania yunnanensis TaxID=152371 RepID=A0AAP0JKY4_9MAGN